MRFGYDKGVLRSSCGNGYTFMEQLSGLDSAFVHQDSARTPMHVTAVLVYDVVAQENGQGRMSLSFNACGGSSALY
jgi:hypothetical protein